MKSDSRLSDILVGILYFILGVVFLAATDELIKTFNYVLVCICAIIGVIQLIQFFVNKKYINSNYTDLLLAVVFIWVSLVLYKYYMVAMFNVLPILFSLYLFVISCDMFGRYMQRDRDIKNEKWFIVYRYLILAIVALIIGLLLIFNPGDVIFVYLKITGLYLIIVSVLHFFDLFKSYKKEKQN